MTEMTLQSNDCEFIQRYRSLDERESIMLKSVLELAVVLLRGMQHIDSAADERR